MVPWHPSRSSTVRADWGPFFTQNNHILEGKLSCLLHSFARTTHSAQSLRSLCSFLLLVPLMGSLTHFLLSVAWNSWICVHAVNAIYGHDSDCCRHWKRPEWAIDDVKLLLFVALCTSHVNVHPFIHPSFCHANLADRISLANECLGKQVTRGHNIVADGWAGASNPHLQTTLPPHKNIQN